MIKQAGSPTTYALSRHALKRALEALFRSPPPIDDVLASLAVLTDFATGGGFSATAGTAGMGVASGHNRAKSGAKARGYSGGGGGEVASGAEFEAALECARDWRGTAAALEQEVRLLVS